MIISSDFDVAEPVEKIWRFFDNIPQVASCLPGAELTKYLGEEKYEGQVAIRMGPVRLQFAGTADITERDEAAKRIVVRAAGADDGGRGQAAMVVSATLSAKGRGTKVAVIQDLQLSGETAEQIAAAGAGSSVRGFTIAVLAARRALMRVFARFFLPLPARELTESERRAAMVLWWIGNVILLVVVLPVVIYLLNRVLAALERIRAASDDILAGGVALVGQLGAVPDALAVTDKTIEEVKIGAVRYAGSVAKLLG